MLDIAILKVDKPIMHNGERVGFLPRLFLGNHTPINKNDLNELFSETKPYKTTSLTQFNTAVKIIGKNLYGETLLDTKERGTHPIAQKEIQDTLSKLFPKGVPTAQKMKEHRSLMQSFVQNSFSPEEQVMMLLELKNAEQQKNKRPEQEQVFNYGFARCLQTLKDMRDQLSPVLQGLSRRSTHRWQIKDYSRS